MVFRDNFSNPQRINEMLDSPNEVVWVAKSDPPGDNTDAMATHTAPFISCFSDSRPHAFCRKSVFNEGGLFFTLNTNFSPFFTHGPSLWTEISVWNEPPR